MTSNLGITLSSRVRLARNAKSLAFVDKLSNEQQEDIVNMAKNAILNSNNVLNKTIKFYDMSVIDEIEKQNLIEKHLISPKIAEEKEKAQL